MNSMHTLFIFFRFCSYQFLIALSVHRVSSSIPTPCTFQYLKSWKYEQKLRYITDIRCTDIRNRSKDSIHAILKSESNISYKILSAQRHVYTYIICSPLITTNIFLSELFNALLPTHTFFPLSSVCGNFILLITNDLMFLDFRRT
jgi:hypothetical protein